MIERIFVVEWPRHEQHHLDSSTNGPTAQGKFWVQTQEELEAIRDTPTEAQAHNSLFGAMFVVATPEEWAKLLLLIMAGDAEPWRLRMRAFPPTKPEVYTGIIQPDSAAVDWREATLEETQDYLRERVKRELYEARTTEVPVPGEPSADVTRRSK